MSKFKVWALLLGLAPLAVIPAACADDADDRAALENEELDRDLDLALQGDTTPAVFEDTAVAAEPAAEAPAQPATRRPAAQPRPSAPRPDPTPTRRDQGPRTVTLAVPSGSNLSLRLNQTLSTESNHVGDPFTATLSEALVVDGQTVVPAGATVRGRVTAVDKSDHVGETAVIKLAFEAVSFGGRSYPLQATVVDTEPQKQTRSSTKSTAGKVAAGAAAGAVIGQVLGKDTKSTVKGAVIGAAAGTAVALGTTDVDVILPSGSRMVIRLDTPIEVTKTVS